MVRIAWPQTLATLARPCRRLTLTRRWLVCARRQVCARLRVTRCAAKSVSSLFLECKALVYSQRIGVFTALFYGKIEPQDIMQGGLGNCWLMAAIACVAEFPDLIDSLFKDDDITPDGKYTLRLYSVESDGWLSVEIDDIVPASCDQPQVETPLSRLFSSHTSSPLHGASSHLVTL